MFNLIKSVLSFLINSWDIVAIFILGIAVISVSIMQSNQKEEIDELKARIEILERQDKEKSPD